MAHSFTLLVACLPLRHPAIRGHIHHVDLAFGRVQDLVPQAGVVDRERLGLERGRDDSGQVGVVAVIQHLVEFVLGPHGTGAALLQVVEDQQGGGFDLVETAIE